MCVHKLERNMNSRLRVFFIYLILKSERDLVALEISEPRTQTGMCLKISKPELFVFIFISGYVCGDR